MRRIIIFLVFFIFLILPASVLSLTENECEEGGGEWIISQIASTDEPMEKDLEPYCRCDDGFYWDNSLKSCVDDREKRCSQTGGTWVNDECQCPSETIKWTPGFGCDMPGPVAETNTDTISNLETEPELEDKKSSLILIFVLALIIGMIIYFKRRRKT